MSYGKNEIMQLVCKNVRARRSDVRVVGIARFAIKMYEKKCE